jgi:hypothetical protein
MMLKSIVNLIPPPLENLHLNAPPVSTLNCTLTWLAQVLPSLLLRYVIVIQMWADSSTPLEQFLPVLLPLQGDYGMLKKA